MSAQWAAIKGTVHKATVLKVLANGLGVHVKLGDRTTPHVDQGQLHGTEAEATAHAIRQLVVEELKIEGSLLEVRKRLARLRAQHQRQRTASLFEGD